jgi:spore germination protein GerM
MKRNYGRYAWTALLLLAMIVSAAFPARDAAASTSAATGDRITITSPTEGSVIGDTASERASPMQGLVLVAGSTNFWPFEANLTARMLDAHGNELGIRGIPVQSPGPPQGGPFAEQLVFTLPATAQNGTLQVYEASAKDGSILVISSVGVRLAAAPATTIQMSSPIPGTGVTLPLHVALRGAHPTDQLVARLRYSNGTVLEQPLHIVAGPNGVGYAVANMAWNTEGPPPPTTTGTATFQIVRTNGTVVKSFAVNVLTATQTRLVDVAWTVTDSADLIVFKQLVYRDARVGTAALKELVNGPPDGNLAGAGTAFPSLYEILHYAGREADWGYEVKLLSLSITNGTATANFSQELRAFGGGATRVGLIRAQIERTLKQFPTVQRVIVQIEGDPNALEP